MCGGTERFGDFLIYFAEMDAAGISRLDGSYHVSTIIITTAAKWNY